MASRAVLKLIRAAREGHAASQHELGHIYLDGGYGFSASERTAYLWLSRAAEKGYAPAWRLIGERIGAEAVIHDPRCLIWYDMAAEAGIGHAQLTLAQLLMRRDRHASVPRAEILLRCALAQGVPGSGYELGRLLLQSGDAASCGEGAALLEQAYEDGHWDAAHLLADYYWETKHIEHAHRWYQRCADLPDPERCFRTGLLAAMLGLPGERLLEQAAAAGHVAACEELGLRYALGGMNGGGTRRLKKAVRWLERAASRGSAKACFILGKLFRHPTFSLRDRAKARIWLFAAARAGHPEAQRVAADAILADLAAGRVPDLTAFGGHDADVVALRLLSQAKASGVSGAHERLERLLVRADTLAAAPPERWQAFVTLVKSRDLDLAARLSLARTLGLTTRELLLVDPTEADQGDCFVIDFRPLGCQHRRRIILVETAEQSKAIEEAKDVLSREERCRATWRRDYRTSYRRLRKLSAHAGLELLLFPHTERRAENEPCSVPAAVREYA